MIAHAKIKSMSVFLASVLCFGFAGAANGMEGQRNKTALYLILDSARKISSFEQVGEPLNPDGICGKTVRELEPFSSLSDESFSRSYLKALMAADASNTVAQCMISCEAEDRPLALDIELEIEPLKNEAGGINYRVTVVTRSGPTRRRPEQPLDLEALRCKEILVAPRHKAQEEVE